VRNPIYASSACMILERTIALKMREREREREREEKNNVQWGREKETREKEEESRRPISSLCL